MSINQKAKTVRSTAHGNKIAVILSDNLCCNYNFFIGKKEKNRKDLKKIQVKCRIF